MCKRELRNFLNVPLQVKEFDDNEKTVFFQNTQLLFFEKSLFFKGRDKIVNRKIRRHYSR
jgi:hypothetical protein